MDSKLQDKDVEFGWMLSDFRRFHLKVNTLNLTYESIHQQTAHDSFLRLYFDPCVSKRRRTSQLLVLFFFFQRALTCNKSTFPHMNYLPVFSAMIRLRVYRCKCII